jgi:hypothetical protein
MAQLIHPELSYQVRGALLHAYNTLGPMLKEEYYEEAIAIGLEKRQIRFQTQKEFEVYYEGERVGLRYEYIKHLPVEYEGHLLGYQDVRLILVEGKVLLATFALCQADAMMAEQLKIRMRRLGIKLGLLANFYDTKPVVTPVRIT